MKEIIIENSKDKFLKFTGNLAYEIDSNSKNKERYSVLQIFKTDKDTYVCVKIGRSKLKNEYDFIESREFNSLNNIEDFFGHGWLSKKLYNSLNLNYIKSI